MHRPQGRDNLPTSCGRCTYRYICRVLYSTVEFVYTRDKKGNHHKKQTSCLLLLLQRRQVPPFEVWSFNRSDPIDTSLPRIMSGHLSICDEGHTTSHVFQTICRKLMITHATTPENAPEELCRSNRVDKVGRALLSTILYTASVRLATSSQLYMATTRS